MITVDRNALNYARLFTTLGSVVRLKILKFLYKKKESSVSEIVYELRVNLPLVSRHLTVLKNAHIVKYRREKNRIYYSIIDTKRERRMPVDLLKVLKPYFLALEKHNQRIER
ncbi:MAG: ArsR family transcriptional regulator [Elusimicrobia bacterium CG06_land_8_20_14_3_00_38_11]|nr:MAG: ArsR family transcriptional regulator [Elusimicrobia bacterium CG06_land_8_20_14_3_00_38_11]